MLPISVTVSYGLREYLRFLREHLNVLLLERAAKKSRQVSTAGRLVTWLLLLVIAPPVFLYKVVRVGKCRFTIDSTNIVRASKIGELVIPWSTVTAVHCYEPGYLIAMKVGAVPIPYRVFNAEQAAEMSAVLAAWRGQSEHAT